MLESKAAVSSFCLELQKKLGMRYEAPPLPVNIELGNKGEKAKAHHRLKSVGILDTDHSGGTGSEVALGEGFETFLRLFENKKDK